MVFILFFKKSQHSLEIYQSLEASGWPKWFYSTIIFQTFMIVFNET